MKKTILSVAVASAAFGLLSSVAQADVISITEDTLLNSDPNKYSEIISARENTGM